MPKRKNFICGLRKLDKWPNGSVGRTPDDEIYIAYQFCEESPWSQIICSQADARLIAKRITQFIDNGG